MLRLEFLPSRFPECPLLRISGDDLSACLELQQTFKRLADGGLGKACISDLPGIEAIDDCRLTAFMRGQNRGVLQVGVANAFEWFLTSAGWDNNAGLIEPFCTSPASASYQWLDSPSDIAVLFSPSGQW
jgi:hypothetical protein